MPPVLVIWCWPRFRSKRVRHHPGFATLPTLVGRGYGRGFAAMSGDVNITSTGYLWRGKAISHLSIRCRKKVYEDCNVMNRLRVAVVGAGNIAQQHLRVLTNHPACEVAVLCDRNPAVLAESAARFGIAQQETSAEALLKRDDLDAVFLMVTHTVTVRLASLFINAGIPTLLEKPPGLFSSETAGLADLHAKRGGIAMVGLNRRFYASHLATREALGQHGPLRTLIIEAHEDLKRMTTSRFSAAELPLLLRRRAHSNGIHALDLIRYFGGEVKDVHAYHAQVENDFPDCFSAVLEFASGAHGRVCLDLIGPGRQRFELRGIGATFTSELGLGAVTLTTRGDAATRSQNTTVLDLDPDDVQYKAGFWKQDTTFLEAVRAGKQPAYPAASPADAQGTMELIDRICQLPATPG